MCGIAGWLSPSRDYCGVAGRMAKALRHRGPDGQGVQSWPGATLVHTRLSIIDLSPNGAQPMSNEDGTVWVVCNGEIYNHLQIRRELEGRGHRFRGRSDTEILPHLYEEYGPALLDRLRGMFALAIYDTRTESVFLARDRIGIKPLFYAFGKDWLAFASEIPALLEMPGIDNRPDAQAMSDFAALLYIPAPETFYMGIRALQPSEMLEARREGNEVVWKKRIYHHWVIAPDPGLSLSSGSHHADGLINEAVKRQVESDVPLGSLLSGGIDSSLVSAAAQTALDGKLLTFNVGFSDENYDETWAALAVAQHIGSQHKTLGMGAMEGSWEFITSLLQDLGQPFADTSIFAVNSICQVMRQYLKVVLSGDGGDEGFGGYNRYKRLNSIATLQRLPDWLWPKVWYGSAVGLSIFERLGNLPPKSQRYRNTPTSDADTSVMEYQYCPVPKIFYNSLCRDLNALPVSRLFEPQWEHRLPPRANRTERLSALATEINIRLELANDFLFKVDMASMREGLEVRVPLLDEEVLAFGLTLPHSLKVKNNKCKAVLRQIAKERLPWKVATKPKMGFSIPAGKWVDEEFKEKIRDTFSGGSSILSDFYDSKNYQPVIDAFCSGGSHPDFSGDMLFRMVIMLLSVQLTLTNNSPSANAINNIRVMTS